MTTTAEKAAIADRGELDKGSIKNAIDKSEIDKNTNRAGSQGTEKMMADKGTAEKIASGPTPSAATPTAVTPSAAATTENRPVLAHDKRKALGRGLESLLGSLRPKSPVPTPGVATDVGGVATAANLAGTAPAVLAGAAFGDSLVDAPVPGVIAEMQAVAARRKPDEHEVLDLSIDRIDVNPHQTRSFTKDEIESLQELSESIKVQGIIQPITVRPGKDGRFFLITGERRMRASTMAGKTTIAAIVRIVSEQQAAEMTVIENLQRRDLNCVDLARAYIMLSQDFGMTQEQIGGRVGVSRETVSNYMRLAKLPEVVQIYLQNGSLEFSHARLLLNLADSALMTKIAHKAVNEEMSVDQLEHYIVIDQGIFLGEKSKTASAARGARWVDPNVRAAQRRLEEILGVRVKIRDRKGKGKITLEYSTLEDFDRVVAMLTGDK